MEAAAAPTAAPAAPAPSTPSAPAPTASPSAAPAPSPASTGAPASTPAPGTAADPSAPPVPKRYTVKANGAAREIDAAHVDAIAEALGLDPQEILKGAQMNASAYQRWQEAAKLRKEAEERETAWRARYEDPRVTQIKQQNPGMDDDDAWALARVLALKEREEMSPELRALHDERSKREALEKQMKEREDASKKSATEAETKAHATRLERELIEAVTKHGMGNSPATGRAVLDHLSAMARAGEVPDVEAAALFVRRRMHADDAGRFGAMNDEQLESWLGKPIVDRILKRSIEKARGVQPAVPTPPTPKPAEPEGRKFLTEDEWRAKYR